MPQYKFRINELEYRIIGDALGLPVELNFQGSRKKDPVTGMRGNCILNKS